MDLLELRNEIDEIDEEIVNLFEKRVKVSEQVARYKIETGKAVFDPVREKQKIAKVRSLASTDFNANGVESMFNQIMAVSRVRQYKMMTKDNEKFGFICNENDSHEGRIVYQGVEGAYGHQAMMAYFGEDADAYHVPTFENVMIEVTQGRADYGVLPVENSSTGIITDVYDLMNKYDISIVGEQVVKVQHALLGLPGADISDIKVVYSHPQGLFQCSDFLEQYEDWEQVSLQNTAVSAKKVVNEKKKYQAAIASTAAAKIYGLSVLEEAINNNRNNSTRFIIIKKDKEFSRNADSISITFELAHEAGSLYHVLGFIIYNNLNMTKIESRPIQGEKWHYRFFIDFDGNLNDVSVRDALVGIQTETVNFKILGNYVAED